MNEEEVEVRRSGSFTWSKDKLNPLDEMLYDRLHNNQDFLVACVGDKGSGKSWNGSLKRGQMIDPDFSIDNVVFSTEELENKIKVEEGEPGYCGKGTVLIVEEGGVRDTASARNWWSDNNQKIGEIFQLVRYRNVGFILNVPDMSLLDSSVRKLVHMKFVASKKGGKYYLKPTWLKKFRKGDKTVTYDQYPRIRYGPRKGARIVELECSPPSEELVEKYEAKAKEYKDRTISDGSSSAVDYLYRKVKKKILKEPEKFSVPMSTKKGRSLRNTFLREYADLSGGQVKKVRPFLMRDEEVLTALGREV